MLTGENGILTQATNAREKTAKAEEEEKIQMAERNGDDKGKIELIRYRQRMQKEYQRINKFRFDPQRLNR